MKLPHMTTRKVLPEDAIWHDNVDMLMRNDPVGGNIEGAVNRPNMQLTDRTAYLKYNLEELSNQVNSGFVLLSSFEEGSTLTLSNEVLLYKADGQYYRWTGDLPKGVPVDSTPDSTGGIGGGKWVLIGDGALRSQLASNIGSNMVGYQLSSDAISRKVEDKLSEFPSISDYIDINDTGDLLTEKIQTALNTHRIIRFPAGEFEITKPLYLNNGQIILGAGNPNFSENYTKIINNQSDGSVFRYSQPNYTKQVLSPSIYDLGVVADYPIKFNDEVNANIVDGPNSNMPYGMRAVISNCDITARTKGYGIGVSWSKQFDGSIAKCDIDGFAINVLLFGCDICRVHQCRILSATNYQILELSAGTFGSQNEIHQNDILSGGDNSIYIKTTARHARIYNNYLEKTSGSVAGFIDASFADMPPLITNTNANTSSGRYTSIIRDNRIDGMNLAKEFIYRYQPEGQTYGEIIDVGTVGLKSNNVLFITDKNGIKVNRLPTRYNQINSSAFKFISPAFGNWNNYTTDESPSLQITSRNINQFGADLYSNLGSENLKLGANTFFILNGFSSPIYLRYDKSIFDSNSIYKVTLRARCTNDSDEESLKILLLANTNSQILDCNLKSEMMQFTASFSTYGLSTIDKMGIGLIRTNNTQSEIEIESILISKSGQILRDINASSVVTFEAKQPYGELIVIATGSYKSPARYYYKFVDKQLLKIASAVTTPSAVDISMKQDDSIIEFTVTGASSNKLLTIQHLN